MKVNNVCFPPIAHMCESPVMKSVLLIIGVAAVLMGLLWIGQGTGLVRWPASSFMIDQRPWVTRGVILAVVGLILIVVSRKR